jgi:hypothetical protein
MNGLLEVGNTQSELPKYRPTSQINLVCGIEQIHYIFPYMCIRIGSTEVEHSTCHTFFYLALQPQFGPSPTSMKLSVSLRFTRS